VQQGHVDTLAAFNDPLEPRFEPDVRRQVSMADNVTCGTIFGTVDRKNAAAAASQAPTTAGAANPAETASAVAQLATIPIKGKAPKTGYSREQFGAAWSDVDHNGCDTRFAATSPT
jgi:hypothetical protein